MDHLHLKGNVYQRSKAFLSVFSSAHVSCTYACVFASHQQRLLHIHRGVRWGTVHAPWSF